MKHFFLLALSAMSLLYACKGDEPETPCTKVIVASTPDTVELCFNQTMTIPELKTSLKFDRVLEESRCPLKVECIRQGRAIINLSLTSDAAKADRSLSFGELDATHRDTASFGSLHLRLIDVVPHPVAGVKTPDQDYKIKVSVYKKQ
jgi:hypothetical protein